MGNEFKKIANESGDSYAEVTEDDKFKVRTGGFDRIQLNDDGSGSCVLASAGGGLSNIVEDTTPQLGGNLDMNGHKIVGVTDPTTNQEAATKKYVDDNGGGVEWVNVKNYGTVGNGITNDTTAINAANTALGLGETTEPTKTLYFPPGTYLVTPGGLDKWQCNIKADEAVFRASADNAGHVVHIQPTSRYAVINIRGIIGYNSSSIHAGAGVTIDTNTTGLLVTHAHRSTTNIEHLQGLQVAIKLDSYNGGANQPTSECTYNIGTLMKNGHGVVQIGGADATSKSEANRFYIRYLVGNGTGIYLNAQTYNTGLVCSNLYDILVFEMHYTDDEDGIHLNGPLCYTNKFIVHGALVPPDYGDAGSTGKIVIISNGAKSNYFQLCYVDWEEMSLGTTSDNIFDTATAYFGHPGADAGNGRSHISGGGAPTHGRWQQGSICWKANATAGGPMGWMCVTSGSPGTWKAMANLAS